MIFGSHPFGSTPFGGLLSPTAEAFVDINLTAVSASAGQILTSQILDKTITGVQSNAISGSIVVSQQVNKNLSTVSSSLVAGNILTDQSLISTLVGSQSNLNVGSISINQAISIALTGLSSLSGIGDEIPSSAVSLQLDSNQTTLIQGTLVKGISLSISGTEIIFCPDTKYDIDYFGEDYVVSTNISTYQDVTATLQSPQISAIAGNILPIKELSAQVSGVNSVSAVGSAVVTNVVYIDIAGSEALSFVDNLYKIISFGIIGSEVSGVINTFGVAREEIRNISTNVINSFVGNITAESSTVISIIGLGSSAAVGTVVSNTDSIVLLSGIAVTSIISNATKSFDTTVNLTGVEAVIYTGIETPESGFDKQLTSVVSNVNISSVSTTTAISFGIVGNSAIGTAESLNQQFIIIQLSPLTEIFGSIANTTNTVYDLRDMPTHLIVDAPSMSEEMGVILLNNNDSDIVTY